jgi:hypothetical protein
MVRIPHYLGCRLKDGGKFVSPKHRSRSTHQKYYLSASDIHIHINFPVSGFNLKFIIAFSYYYFEYLGLGVYSASNRNEYQKQ